MSRGTNQKFKFTYLMRVIVDCQVNLTHFNV